MASYERRFFYKGNAMPIPNPFTYTPSYDETITLQETFTKSTTRSFSETITLAETFTKLIAKSFNETITLVETFLRSIGKALNETITIVDTLTKAITRSFSESLSLTDTLTMLLNKISAGIPDLISGAIRSIKTLKPEGSIGLKNTPIGGVRTKDIPDRR